MQCTNPVWLERGMEYKGMEVPCGKCRACRIRRSFQWTMRLQHESHCYGNKSMFITLTYSDEHLPINWSLEKKELQKFFKRVRKNIKGRKISYYACGEYGDLNGRPHYHSIVLGLDCGNYDDRYIIAKSWKFCDWKKILSSQRGKSAIGTVTPDSMRYVTDYIHKKFIVSKPKKREGEAESSYNDRLVSYYINLMDYYGRRESEFQLCSLGIGKKWLETQVDDIKKSGKIKYNGKEVGLPRYYSDKVEVNLNVKLENSYEVKKKLMDEYDVDISDVIDHDVLNRVIPVEMRERRKQREKNLTAYRSLKEKNSLGNNYVGR